MGHKFGTAVLVVAVLFCLLTTLSSAANPEAFARGLGLSISKGIIESHGGRIYFDRSCPNTRFVIEIPIHQNAAVKQKLSGTVAA